MNNFEYDFKMKQQSAAQGIEINEDIKHEIELQYKIYDHHFANDLKSFISFLKNKNNMIYFLARAKCLGTMPSDLSLYIAKNIVEPHVETNEQIDNYLYQFDEEIFTQVLVEYFTYFAIDISLMNSAFQKACINYDDDEISELLDEIRDKQIAIYQNVIKEKYIPSILDALFPLEEKINSTEKFDEEEMIKNFYSLLTKNSFDVAIQQFDDSSLNIISNIKSSEIQQDFLTYSEEAKRELEHKKNMILDGETALIFEESFQESWVRILQKSKICFDCTYPYASLLTKAMTQYIVSYSMLMSIKGKKVINKNFEKISKFSKLLNFIKDLTKLHKTNIQFIFFKLLIDCLEASTIEAEFLIAHLWDDKKRTIKKNKDILPSIQKINCPILDIF